MTDVSIIIVNWNTREILRDCLASVFAQTKDITYELIVVDNASKDGSARMVKNEFPEVFLIENTSNVGFAAANNHGMKIAAGRYFLLLNPDTIVLDGAIQKTVAFADTQPAIAVVGCQVWLNDHEIQLTCFPFPSLLGLVAQESGLRRLFPRSRLFGQANYGWWDRQSQMDVEVVSGMYMLTRKQAIEQVGLMDEDYFIYAEETDWCFRLRKAGWRCVFFPGAQIIHLDGGSKSTGQMSVKMFVQQHKSLLIFFRKQAGFAYWLSAKMIYISSMLLRLPFFSFIAFLTKNPIAANRSAQAAAALKFHLGRTEPE